MVSIKTCNHKLYIIYSLMFGFLEDLNVVPKQKFMVMKFKMKVSRGK